MLALSVLIDNRRLPVRKRPMTFSHSLIEKLAEKHLLKHDFYQAWNEGSLTRETLRTYGRQYFHHVDAFARYISATHSNCRSIEARQFLLENLNDEEKGSENHPELWKRFVEGLGETRENIEEEFLFPETRYLIDTFLKLSRSSYAEGLGALFAYEQQVPEISKTKIEGLKKHYDVTDSRALQFFEVHRQADVYHSEACAKLIDALSETEKYEAQRAALKAADALWGFLDGIRFRQAA